VVCLRQNQPDPEVRVWSIFQNLRGFDQIFRLYYVVYHVSLSLRHFYSAQNCGFVRKRKEINELEDKVTVDLY
jgi:hypothetical protein